ncbi:MAG: tetratricopeptide repeat protein [Gammaproteobacteria bacterium]|nr:tetratricopeptide repeat protein [Gammaproteobacteria bacterium]
MTYTTSSYPSSNDTGQSHQKMSIPEAMQTALNYYQQGNLTESEALLKRILEAVPQHAHALHLLGVLTHQAGNTETAVNMIGQAILINPREGLFFSNIGEMCRILKNTEDAIKYGEQAIKLMPESASAHSNLGIAYFDNKEIDKASECQLKALSLSPDLVAALNNLGSIARERKDKQQAIEYYRKVLTLSPQHLESINNLGAVLTELERPEEAIEVLKSAIKLNPDYAEAHCNIATSFLASEQIDIAEKGFKKAIELKADYSEAYQGLAKVYQEQKELPKALEMANKALTLTPERDSVHSLLGGIHTECGYPDKAEIAYARALELDAQSVAAHLGKGHLLMEQGHMAESEACFSHALSLDDSNLGARLSLVQVKKVTADDDNFKELVTQAKDLNSMLETKALPLHFALGKSYDDTKQYDLAFKHYLEGCRLKRKRIHYNSEDNDRFINNIKDFFTEDVIAGICGQGCDSKLPVFVLGMPRSGTTLTEQIIASHPDVHGAGELPDLLQLANHPHGWETAGYPGVLRDFSPAQFKTMGEKYVTSLKERAPKARHITDKMPANFNCVGLIHLILPNAKIVHIKRSPVDTCLSGFSRLFNKSQFQSYDLTEIGHYYRNYHELMQHWRNVLPEGSFYELQYEDLVADTENQAKALIEYCGLDWDDNCLEFHKHERNIRTASVTQVRQPIYKTSVERWRTYQEHLGPLFAALGDLAPI